MPKAKSPLYVVVANGHYDMIGAPTLRNKFLARLLTAQGGVNESVEDGTYIYRAKRLTLHGLEVTLLPAKTE